MMAKKKNFSDWVSEDYDTYVSDESKFKKKDSKRYDHKKAKIQNARRRKAKMKTSYFDGV